MEINELQKGMYACLNDCNSNNPNGIPTTYGNYFESYAIVKDVTDTDVVLESCNKKPYTMPIGVFLTHWRRDYPVDMRGNEIKIGDRVAFADSGKDMVLAVCVGFAAYRMNNGWQIPVKFGDIDTKSNSYSWKKSAKTRLNSYPSSRIILTADLVA
jgi:hypothetical protein